MSGIDWAVERARLTDIIYPLLPYSTIPTRSDAEDIAVVIQAAGYLPVSPERRDELMVVTALESLLPIADKPWFNKRYIEQIIKDLQS